MNTCTKDLQRGLLRTLKRLKRKPCVADRRNKIAGLRERLGDHSPDSGLDEHQNKGD